LNAPVRSPLVCSVCEREHCDRESHDGPDRRFVTREELQRERIEKAKASLKTSIGRDVAVLQSCRDRIARLQVDDVTVEARNKALVAIDNAVEVYLAARAANPPEPFL
jgi:hypothetical protein